MLGAVILSAVAACDLFRPGCGPWLEVPGDPETSSSVPRVRGVPGQRLVDQVPPGEGDIEVVFHSEAPFIANFGTADEEIASLVARAEAIVVAEAVRIESSLTPTEDGIESVVDLVVSEVLMSGEGLAAVIEGQHLQVRVNGGTLLVGGRRLTTRRNGEVVPRVGAAYLFPLFVTPATFVPPDRLVQEPALVPLSPFQAFEIRENGLRRLWRHPEMCDALAAAEPASALQQFRAEIRRQKGPRR